MLKIQIACCQSDSDLTQICQPVVPMINALQRSKQVVKYCDFIKLLQTCSLCTDLNQND